MAIIKEKTKVAGVAAAKKAAAQKAVPAPKNEQRKDNKIYISAQEEVVKMEDVLRGERFKSYWDSEREYLFFSISPKYVEAFEMHTFFVSGKFIDFEE